MIRPEVDQLRRFKFDPPDPSATISAKRPPFGTFKERVLLVGILVGDVFYEQKNEDIVLVLRGIRATA